jgi:hypothetical protein
MATTRKTKTGTKKADRPKTDTQKTDAPPDPDSLVRQAAGNYLSGDGRFEVRESDSNWFLIDTQQTNEFGQELLQGPFPSLKAVREKMPGARKVTPLPRSRTRPAGKGVAEKVSPKAAAPPPAPPPPPPTWIDRLPAKQASEVRQLIRAVERAGLPDAEKIVRKDREGLEPVVATQLIERRLATLVDELPEADRKQARALLGRALEIISGEGAGPRRPLPGWVLIETGPEPEPPNRRIRLR